MPQLRFLQFTQGVADGKAVCFALGWHVSTLQAENQQPTHPF